jgi:hypothetical protein
MSDHRGPLAIRPHGTTAKWSSSHNHYAEYADACLGDLIAAIGAVNSMWPGPLGQPVEDGRASPELWEAARRRDYLSDSSIIFAALAVEAFVNFYGAVRISDVAYEARFERLSVKPKLMRLLQATDALTLEDDHTLITLALRIASRRNRLVHPKAKETTHVDDQEAGWGDKLPEAAQQAVADMHAFFREFATLLPEAAYLLP